MGFIEYPSLAFVEKVRPLSDPDLCLAIVCGRHRTAAGCRVERERGTTTLPVLLYQELVAPPLASWVGFIENMQRKDSWRKEVVDLHSLMQRRIELSFSDLKRRFGLRRKAVEQRLAVARLNGPLFDLCVRDKKVSFAEALKMTELTPASQKTLTDLLGGGAFYSPEAVQTAWRQQVNGADSVGAPEFFASLTSPQVLPQGKGSTVRPMHDASLSRLLEELSRLLLQAAEYAVPTRRRGLLELCTQEVQRWALEAELSAQSEEYQAWLIFLT